MSYSCWVNSTVNDLAYGQDQFEPAFAVACLKRALGHLHAAQETLAAVEKDNPLPLATVNRVRRELFEIREGILNLMNDFRGKSAE